MIRKRQFRTKIGLAKLPRQERIVRMYGKGSFRSVTEESLVSQFLKKPLNLDTLFEFHKKTLWLREKWPRDKVDRVRNTFVSAVVFGEDYRFAMQLMKLKQPEIVGFLEKIAEQEVAKGTPEKEAVKATLLRVFTLIKGFPEGEKKLGSAVYNLEALSKHQEKAGITRHDFVNSELSKVKANWELFQLGFMKAFNY